METVMDLKRLSDRELSDAFKKIQTAWQKEEDEVMRKSCIELMYEFDDEMRIRGKSRKLCLLREVGLDHLIRR